jgi:hypothetical protein
LRNKTKMEERPAEKEDWVDPVTGEVFFLSKNL